MKDVKNFFGTLKSWWDNPRLKGVVQLIFWAIFFIIVAIMFRSGKSDDTVKNENNNSNNTNNNEVISYEYKYQYIDNTNTIVINGTHYDNKEKFSLNNTNYYSIDDKYFDDVTKTQVDIAYAIDEWKYSSIKNITDHNAYSNLTKYKSGIEKYEYNLSKEIYNNYYGNTYPNDIIITITKKDNNISEATVDYVFGKAIIKYTNINEIDSLDINVD